jgi:hypothetical protein
MLSGLVLGDNDEWEPLAYFCYHFLRAVVGFERWKKIAAGLVNMSEVATASDIAYGIVVLENSLPCWEWEFGKTKEDIKELENNNDPAVTKPKYTTGHGKNAKKDCGWSEDGVGRYNDLVAMVQQARIEDESHSFDAYFKTYIRERDGVGIVAANEVGDGGMRIEAVLDF